MYCLDKKANWINSPSEVALRKCNSEHNQNKGVNVIWTGKQSRRDYTRFKFNGKELQIFQLKKVKLKTRSIFLLSPIRKLKQKKLFFVFLIIRIFLINIMSPSNKRNLSTVPKKIRKSERVIKPKNSDDENNNRINQKNNSILTEILEYEKKSKQT